MSEALKMTRGDDPGAVETLVWFTSSGAERGEPWAVRHHDGTQSTFKAVQITGTVQFVEAPPDLIDGPRYVAKLVDGTLLAGR